MLLFMGSVLRRVLAGRAVLALLALALVAASPRAVSAADPEPSPAATDPRSVYKIWPWLDGSIIVGTNALSAGLYFFVQPTPRCPCDRNEVNSFDRDTIDNHSDVADMIGTSLVVGSAIIPVGLDFAILGANKVAVEDTVVMAEALSISGALVSIAKSAFPRPYPRTYAGSKVNDATNYQSFYSGHTAIAFTALSTTAMTIGRRYDIHVIPWIITGVVGSGVAISMVAAGWHFPSDVLVGAALGTGAGIAVPIFHYRGPPVRPVVMRGPNDTPILGLGGVWM
jgi:membrane-associated phospholipid phosphatase